jgi:hypothetical protein
VSKLSNRSPNPVEDCGKQRKRGGKLTHNAFLYRFHLLHVMVPKFLQRNGREMGGFEGIIFEVKATCDRLWD